MTSTRLHAPCNKLRMNQNFIVIMRNHYTRWLTTCEQAHYISPHELVASSMAGKSARKRQKRRGPSRHINPAQAMHLWDPDAKVCELGGDASLPSSACIAFLRLAPFHKTGTDFGSGN